MVTAMTRSPFDLSGRVALITGGNKGLGRAMARGLAEAGADIFIASRNEAELKTSLKYILAGTGRKGGYAVVDVSDRVGIELLFLPSDSPNLNRIERLWKFTKTKALRGKHDPDFAAFRAAIDDCLDRIGTDHRDALASLMTLKCQSFDKASFLAA